MTANGTPALYPLTATQRAIWVAQMLDPQSALYNIAEYLEIAGPIDAVRFAEALRQVIATADSLHLKFVLTPDGPRYFVAPDPHWQLSYLDVSDEADPRAAAEAWMHADAMRRVDLASEPLYCFALFRVAQDRFFWYARYHHLCNDGNGVWLIARRLAAIYSGSPAAEAYRLGSYSNLILADELYRDSALFRRDQSYWSRQMADCPAPATLCGRPPAPPSGFRRRRTRLPRAVLDGTNPAEASGMARLVTAATAICLHRLTGNIDLTIGMAVNGRSSRELRAICGMASQVLPLRLKVRPQDSTRDVVDAAARQHRAAMRHGRYPAENLRNDLGIAPNAPRFFGATVNVVSFDYRMTFDGHPVRVHNVGNWREEDLQIVVYNNLLDADVAFEFVANADHYSDADLAQYQALFLTVLGRVAAADRREQVWQLDVLGSAARARLLAQGRGPAVGLPGAAIAAVFEAHVARDPDAPAVLCGGETLSYAALNRRANRLAHRLIARGVGVDTLVGVAVERSAETIVALLGILKAGGGYVPLAADLPGPRRERLIADAGLSHIVTAADCQADGGPEHNPAVAVHGTAAAYVNYTSGSTGQPKGVLVPQQGVVRLVCGTNYVALDATTRLLHLAPLSFDAATWEIWAALLNGGSLAVMPPGLATAEEIGAEIAARGVNTALLVAGLFPQVVEHALGSLGGVRQLLVGGDVMPVEAVRRVKQAYPALRLVNAYGPTENTTISSCYEVPADATAWEHGVPIGVAISNSQVAVLDDGLEPVPAGVPGELYVSGAGLARGYLNQAALTAERFVADPYGPPGSRMYRTGDLVRWRGDGVLEFIGRVDAQVKLRGFRIEPGEVEAVLKTHPQVRDAIVTVSGEAEHRRLLGYVLSDAAAAPDAAAQEAWLGHWQELYEATYGEGGGSGDFDISGWRSSYTGGPIPAAQMRIWVDETLRLLRAAPAARVVEVGCGTGLLLTRLAVGCERYVGLDFSAAVLGQLRGYVATRPDLGHVELRQGLAHDLSFLSDGSVDLVVLNSIVQYFPDLDYLRRVLAQARRVTRPGGRIVVGDVRSLPLLRAYHASVALHQAEAAEPAAAVWQRAERARRQEEELALDPALFAALARREGGIARVETLLKPGAYDNELSRFRYDVVLEVGDGWQEEAAPAAVVTWDAAGDWREQVGAELARTTGPVWLTGLRDGRVAASVEAVRLLSTPVAGLSEAGPLRAAAAAAAAGEDPDAVASFARAAGVGLSWRGFTADGVYTAVLRPYWQAASAVAAAPDSDATAAAQDFAQDLARYANAPARPAQELELGRTLQAWLRGLLPDYLVPAAVTVLAEWPLTANGKVDRRALPLPGHKARGADAYRAPRTPHEELLCLLFAEMLGLPRVGIDDNFFDLGGHSLLATQTVSRIREMFGVELGVQVLFDAPRVEDLAGVVDAARKAAANSTVALKRPKQTAMPVHIPLSYAQSRLWFIDQLEGSSTQYNMPEVLRLRGTLNLEALDRTIQTIVARHDILRTRFEKEDGEPGQVIAPHLTIPLVVTDLSDLTEADRQSALTQAMWREWEVPFDLARGPLLRVALLKLAVDDQVLLRTYHHIVSDGWSMGVFNREFAELYAAYSEGREDPLPPLPIQYADFTLWQRDWLNGPNLDRGLAYWRRQLADLPDRLALPTDLPRPRRLTYAAGAHAVVLPPDRVAALRQFAQEHRVTLFMLLLANFAVLLHRSSGQNDIVVGSPIANRQDAQLEGLIGFFVNALVMRVRIQPALSFAQLLAEVRRTTLEAYEHQDVPFERLVEDLAPQRYLNVAPIVQVVFALQNAPMGTPVLKGLDITRVIPDGVRVRFDLEVHGFEQSDGLNLIWAYNRDLFLQNRIERMAGHYLTLLDAAVKAPDRPLRSLDMLTGDEARVLLKNRADNALPAMDRTLAQRFEAVVRAQPQAIAVSHGDVSITYAELNAQANRLAHLLIHRETGPEHVVGVYLHRSIESVVALLAILKAGAVYFPLDPENPEARTAQIIADAAPVVVLTDRMLARQLPQHSPTLRLDDPQLRARLAKRPADDPAVPAPMPQHACYVIYTSGSTGRPKGIVLPYATLDNLMTWHPMPGASGRVAQFASIGFDASLQEVFCALLSGQGLIVVDAETRLHAGDLAALLDRARVTDLFCTTSVLEFLAHAAQETDRGLSTLRNVYQAGEPLVISPALRRFFSRHPQLRLHNYYGPSETHVVTAVTLPPQPDAWPQAPSIGTAIANFTIYVLDANLQQTPAGVEGELYISGAGVGRGYLGKAALTAERFVADPLAEEPGARMYRSGDVVRWRPDGSLEFIGRADFQVKIRGFRIEPGEIESALTAHPAIAQAAVVPHEDGRNQKRLVAYVVLTSQASWDEAALRADLSDRLPSYMVPSAFVRLAALPRTVNGKLDRAALPAPERQDIGYVPPRTEQEAELCSIFAEVLMTERVGVEDDFFALGGHSLMVTRVVSRIRARLGVQVAVRSIFETPTVKALAEQLASDADAGLLSSAYAKPSAVIRRAGSSAVG